MTTPAQYVQQLRGTSDHPDLPFLRPSETLASNGCFYDLSDGRLLYAQDQDEGWKWAFRFPTRIVIVHGEYEDGRVRNLTISDTYFILGHGYKRFFMNDFESALGPEDAWVSSTNRIKRVRPGFYEADSKHGYTYFTPHFVRYYNEGILMQFFAVVLFLIGLGGSDSVLGSRLPESD